MTDDVSAREPELPERLGEYRIVRLLGRGGMGVVYEAEQHHTRRSVALKVIRPGFGPFEMLRRFEHEAVVLARLQHPGIASIHEAGTFDVPGEGRQPYFAMELVHGVPLTRYADEHGLGVRERLELMIKISAAVEHAHQRGIVHRDLKPANILVDESGQPKVLDFGVALLTDADVQATTMHTDVGQLIGTVQYMSPEQASGDPTAIDTRSDVYALGVICYELLAGHLPYDLRKRMLHEAVRIIREEEPTPLSSANRSLRGDVETIVAKALEKDKERRYASAGEFGSDIERYLRDEAISARPPSSWYQLSKFARRNRVLVGGVAATFLALVAGLIVSARMYVKVSDARDLAEARRKEAESARAAEAEQRQIAVANEARSNAINLFMQDMLGSANVRDLGRDAKVSQALATAGARVGAAFADRPEIEEAVRGVLARTYQSLGMPDEAKPHVDRWIELAKQLGDDYRRELALAQFVSAVIVDAQGDWAGALEILQRARELAEKALGPEDRITLSIRGQMVNELRELGRLDEAEALGRDNLAIRRRQSGADSQEMQITLNTLAVVLHARKQAQEAEPLYREAAEMGERLWGRENPDTLTALFNLASVERSLGHDDEALALFTELLPQVLRVFGEAHPTTAIAQRTFSQLYVDMGRYREALPLAEAALRTFVRLQGEHTQTVAEVKEELATICVELDDSARAALLRREAWAVFSEVLGPEHVKTLTVRSDLANALSTSGHSDEAEPIFRELVESCTRVLGPNATQTSIVLNSLGVLLQRTQRYDEAEKFLQRALDALMNQTPPDLENIAITTHNLMWAMYERGDPRGAAEQAMPVIARFEQVFGQRHPNTAQALASAAFMLREVGRFAEAEPLCERALDIRRETFGPSSGRVADSLTSLAAVRMGLKRFDEAQQDLEGALESYTDAGNASAYQLARARSLLGECLTHLQRFAEAEPLLVDGQRDIDASEESEPSERRDALKRLNELYTAWNAAEPSNERAQRAAEWKAKLDASPAAAK